MNAMQLLHQATWNELATALKVWEDMNDSLSRNEGRFTKSEHTALRYKIQTLEDRLTRYDEALKKEVK